MWNTQESLMTMALALYRSQNLLGTPLGLREEAVFLVGAQYRQQRPACLSAHGFQCLLGAYRFLKPHQAPGPYE